MQTLAEELRDLASLPICTESVRERFLQRLKDSSLTRDENPLSHYCVYFLPYNPASKKVFIVAHKKSGLWLSPGGHIDQGEVLLQTLKREVWEELGMKDSIPKDIVPSLLTVTPIPSEKQRCKEHLDVWYFLPTDGAGFNVDPREFHETRWTTIAEAWQLIIDRANLQALDKVEKMFQETA